ncbi:gliding motility-associated C-terminal domain-containing protein [Tenacibaculum finnmarkense]|uniref:T9SS type B sorting domain-containing protein n=2 Tax=Tenacibaculum finnmarkense TaxID=2781243 RepID=UPI001E58F975|nr:gliding motility-associated C-terminal domain-containing protein [Tenacibaculum finnmarkense]MCD8409984.1 gliding motility-associated C-terminal domain-containing protein [Tenacibaculum finnmarkense genomovar ulcerans]
MNLSVYKKQVLLVTCLMFLLSITNVFANPYVKNATEYKSEVPFFIEKLSLNKTEVSLSSAAIYNKSYYKLGASKAIKKKETSFFEGMLNAVKGFVFSSKVTAAAFVVGGTGPGDDFDGDGVLNKDDLDDDNDGILDTDEGFCSDELTGTWTGSGASWSSSAGGVTVTCSSTFISPASLYSSGNDTFNTTNYWLPNVAGGASFIYDVNWDSAPEGPTTDIDLLTDDQGSGTLTFTFSTPVVSPVLHIDKLGGSSNGMSNSLNFTLVTPNITLKRLSGTDDFEVTGTTIQKTPNLVLIDVNSEALPEVNRGTAAGSVRLDGVFTSVTFNWKGVGFEGNGGDLIEFAVETCASTDTDSDGTPDYLDLDSDNDGCSDALEGAQTTLTLASVDGKGILTGAVDANGVPTIVNGGQADVSSTDASVTGDECDDDGDGVVNKDDKCNGFDDKADNDTDLVPDGCDLDDDNDGILDSVECTLSFVNFSSNTRFGVGLGEVGIDGSIDVSTRFSLPAGSVIINYENLSTRTTGGQPAVSASQPTTFTITGTVPVYVAIRHGGDLSGVNSYDGIESLDNVTYKFTSTLETGYTDSVLANNYQVISDASSDGNNADKFRWQSSSFVSKFKVVTSRTTLNNNYRLELAICKDTDSDGTPDYLDRDSDNDGCSDALEGAQTTLTLASVDGKGILTGAVDANGVPTIVNGGQADVSSTDPVITGGECDDDGDGVVNKDDICNGFDDKADNDGDLVPDGCDLDDDNDGILDSVEKTCSENGSIIWDSTTKGLLSNTFTASSSTATIIGTVATLATSSALQGPIYANGSGNANIDITSRGGSGAIIGNETVISFPSEVTFSEFNVRGIAAANGSPTIAPNYDETQIIEFYNGTTRVYFDGTLFTEGTGTIYHHPYYDGIDATYASGGPYYNKLTGVAYPGNTTTNVASPAYGGVSALEAGYKFIINEPITKIIIKQSPLAKQDNIGIRILDICLGYQDTDSDGTPDYLDRDSDNDGCPDALEGAQTTLTLASVDGKGILTGAVDANGVPTLVSGGQADVSSTDPAITGGECDDDGDGVLNKDDKCNGFDDAIDSDTDGVPDGCDLDNDNDGILDSVECGALLPGAVTGIDTNTLTGTFTSSVLSTDFTLTSPSQIELPLGNKIPVKFKSYAGVTEGILAYWDEGNVIPNTFDIKFTLQAPVNGVLNALRIASNAPGSAYGAQNAKKQITLTWPGGTRAVLSDPLNEIVNLTDGAVITSGTILELDSGTNQILNSRWYLDIDLAGVSYPFSLDYHTVSSVLTRYEGFSFLPKGCSDLDGDTLTNNLDLDSDADGCNDVLESGGIDADNDGILDGTGFDADGKVTGGVNGYDGATGNEYKATKLTADFTGLTDQTVAEGTATSFTLTSATAETTISYDASNNPVYGTTGNANIGIQYQWYLGDPATGTALTNTGVYSTVTTATLNISDVKGLGGSVYYLKVTHADNVCIESVGSATLSVFDPCKIGAILGTVTANDPDADGINNVCDSDDDNDGISDTDENINNKNPDADADADGIPLYLDDDDTNAAIGDVNNSIEADFDTDNDGIPNHLDLDADNDGIYDVVEAGGTDTNNDGKADHSGADYSDTAGIPDSAFFGLGVIPKNTNTITGNPADFLNIDSDGDGCSDANEAYNNANTDTNSDGTYGGVITSAEVNANGLVTGLVYKAPNKNYTTVSYINSVCYIDICTEAAGTDTDNDDVNDICDVDIDNDGILNENENCNSPVWGTAPLTWIAKDDSGTIKLAGGIDMSIDITTTATGDLDAFGGTALNLSATGTGTFGTLDDLAVLFDPAANQGASPVKIQIDFTKEMYNLNFKITDIDAGGFGFRMDKVTITSDEGNPILTKVSETSSSFTVVNNQATAIRYATSDKDNKGTILVQVPDGAKSITIIYEEVGTVSDPGVRGIGILGDLKYCLDTDNDGTPDSNDLDSDNDGCNDVVESGGIDADNDGILDGTGFDADGKVTGGVNGYDGATGNEYKATKLTADFTALTDQTVAEGTATSFTLTSAIAETTISYDASNNPVYGTTGNANIGIQYQWYLGDPATGTALTNTGVYSTVTTATLNISDVTGLGGNEYYLKVTHADNVCVQEINSATLVVEALVNVTIGDVTVGEGDGNATVPVSIDVVSSTDIKVDITTTSGTAGTADYTEITTTVTIPAGSLTVDVSIPILEDTIDEPNEAFTVNGTINSGNATAPTAGTVTITDNDATPQVTIGDVTVGEGDGNATVPVSIDVVSSVDTVVDIVTSTGTAGTADYTETTTTVTIPAGDTSVDVKIPITDDLIDEPNETFTVGGTVSSGNATDPADGTVTITDNDATPAPTATNDTVTGNTPGDDATVKLLDNDKLSDGTEITDPSTQVTIDLDPTTPGVQNTLVVPNQGTWTVDPATGILTFSPEDGFTQTPTDISYELTETSTGLSDIATVKAGYDEGNPIATNDTSTGNTPGDDATVKLLDNDKLSDGTEITDPSTQVTIDLDPTTPGVQNTLVVPNEGTWTVDPATGILTFNPEDGFTQTPTDISYELTETSTGLSDIATVKAEYTEADPIATNDSSTGNTPGDDATVKLLDNDDLSDGTQATVSKTSIELIDPATGIATTTPNVVTVAGEGVWTLDPLTGNLTFNPEDGFTQTPTDISYELTETSTGLIDTATVKAEYTEADPIATNDSSTGNTPGDDVVVNLLDNDKLSDGTEITDPSTQVTIDLDPSTPGVQNTLVVPNQGTWTVDSATGILTFNPEDGFTQTPTDIIYELTETSTGLSDIATVKAGYDEGNPIATNDTSTGNTPGDDATVKLLDNDKLSDGTEITDPSTQVTIDLDPTTPGVQNTLVVPNQGTWTVDPATGILTFNPIDGCTTDPTEIIYELTETSRGLTDIATVKAGYTEVDPIATDDTSTGNTPGDDISVNVLTDDSLSDGTAITNPATQVTIDLDPTIAGIQNTIVVANQGVWTVNPATGVLIFSPDIGFTTDPTGIIYELTETSTGLSDTATVIMLLDTDSDGIPNVIDIDDDNDGILDTDEGDGILDTDNDGIPDSLDTDSDNDGVVDIIEGNDANADGIPDAIPSGVDTDSDGLDDAFDTDNGGSPVDLSDTDGDGIYDYQDIDDDNDGINTEDENPGDTNITTNDSLDTNENGIPDSLDTDTNKCGTPYNIMTPDNDGENDSFFISCIDKPEYANNTVEIFNRWGNTVYKASGYNNESVSFKGISNGRTTLVVDEKLPAGTYYYIIDLGDGSKAKAGWLYINR